MDGCIRLAIDINSYTSWASTCPGNSLSQGERAPSGRWVDVCRVLLRVLFLMVNEHFGLLLPFTGLLQVPFA